jgi:hypothetical protein
MQDKQNLRDNIRQNYFMLIQNKTKKSLTSCKRICNYLSVLQEALLYTWVRQEAPHPTLLVASGELSEQLRLPWTAPK